MMKSQTERKSSGRMASKGFPNPVDVAIGAKIRERRTAIGMSQTALGEAIGLSFQQVQKYERGANRVGASRIIDLALALGVTPGWFFENLPAEVTDQSPARLLGGAPAPIVPADMPGRADLEFARKFRRLPHHGRQAVLNIINLVMREAGADAADISREAA